MTLEKMIEKEKACRREDGRYGIAACKAAIKFEHQREKCSYFTLLERYYNRRVTDVFFNRRMVLACWELLNDE